MKQTLIAAFAVIAAFAANAYTVSENLKTYAVTQSDNSIVLGTGEHGGDWSYTRDVVYDGRGLDDRGHWFEGGSDDSWAGYEVSTEKTVTRIRYLAGVDNWADRAKRMRGCSFQGANALDENGDFVNPVTLCTIPSDMSLDDLTNGWCEVVITDSALLSQTFKYLRFFAPSGKSGGNVAEVEFYGCDSFPLAAESAPAPPAFTSFAAINGKVTYGFTVAEDAYTYRFERKWADEADWETLDEYVYVNESTMISKSLVSPFVGPAVYRLVAVNAAGETTTTVNVPFYKALTGTVIGATAEDAANHGVENVNDGDISTYYKSSDNGGWIGLDLVSSKTICGIRIVPQKGQNWYCQYFKVQVSNDPTFPDGETTSTEEFYQSWSGGPDDGFSTLYSFAAISGRYVRFKANGGRICGLAEVEFLTDDYTPDAAPTGFAAAADEDTGHAVLSWDLPAVACMTTRVVRTTAPGGGTDTVTTDLRGDVSTWTDETAIAGVTYYYTLQSVNNVNGTEYAGSATAVQYRCNAIQIERAASDQTALRAGMTAIASNVSGEAKVFDGSTAYNSWADGSGDDAKLHGKVGVDLGAQYVITGFKVYPRYQNDWVESWQRSDGMVLAGSDSETWYSDTHELSDQCAITGGDWFEFATTNQTPYRYVFLMKEGRKRVEDYTSSFYGNVAELQLFGYPAAALDVLLAPEVTSVVWKGSNVKLAWAAAQNATSYRIERRKDGGAWEVVATVDGTTYDDTTITHPTKGSYSYRIASLDGNSSVAYTLDFVPTGTPSPRGLVIIFK